MSKRVRVNPLAGVLGRAGPASLVAEWAHARSAEFLAGLQSEAEREVREFLQANPGVTPARREPAWWVPGGADGPLPIHPHCAVAYEVYGATPPTPRLLWRTRKDERRSAIIREGNRAERERLVAEGRPEWAEPVELC